MHPSLASMCLDGFKVHFAFAATFLGGKPHLLAMVSVTTVESSLNLFLMAQLLFRPSSQLLPRKKMATGLYRS